MLMRLGAMRRTAVLEAVVRSAGVRPVGHWMGRRTPAWSTRSRGGGVVTVVEHEVPAWLCLGQWHAAPLCVGSAADLGSLLPCGLLVLAGSSPYLSAYLMSR